MHPYFSVTFKAARVDAEKIILKIYTPSQRLVRQKVFEGAEAYNAMQAMRIRCENSVLSGLANGTYYYVIILEKDKKAVKSGADKVVIIK